MRRETVIGLETHILLRTRSKLFSDAPVTFGAPPNTRANFVDVGLPGVLPVLNQGAVRMAIRFGLAIDATIADKVIFERKNYFYPDLPKGYQITQYLTPIISDGRLAVREPSGDTRFVPIQRAHLEEDAGKSLHMTGAPWTGIDLNRAGNALLEIVTTPCFHDATSVTTYLRALHQLVRFLDICDANMEEGGFRTDVNISIRNPGDGQLGVRTEIKNLNSFRFIEQAIHAEVTRQLALLDDGLPILRETRLYSPETGKTIAMREKEAENDYRYFPCPDLLPLEVTPELVSSVRKTLPWLPSRIEAHLRETCKLDTENTGFILSDPAIWRYFDRAHHAVRTATPESVAHWLKGACSAALPENGGTFDAFSLTPETLATLLDTLASGQISGALAKRLFSRLLQGDVSLEILLQSPEFQEMDDEGALMNTVQAILYQFPQQVQEYQAGKDKLMAFFVGQAMKATRGKANPEILSRLLESELRKGSS